MGQSDQLEISQDIIDRLVDGELEEATRRVILSRLQDDAVLCRRVALAFLENQTWRDVFSNEFSASTILETQNDSFSSRMRISDGGRDLLDDDVTPNDGQSERARATANDSPLNKLRHNSTFLKVVWISAVAASFFLTFLASWYIQSVWFPRSPDNPTLSAVGAKANNATILDRDRGIGHQEEQPSSEPQLELVSIPLPIDEAGTWATLEVPFISSSGTEVAEMIPAGIPEEILESLSAQGHIVEQQRRFVPVSLPDGRQSIVPIDQVKIQFVGGLKK